MSRPKIYEGELRYRIKDLTKDRAGRKIRLLIQVEFNVSASTMQKWVNLPVQATTDIPATALRSFAERLNVSMEDLFNDKMGK